jgi:hypothetical protein
MKEVVMMMMSRLRWSSVVLLLAPQVQVSEEGPGQAYRNKRTPSCQVGTVYVRTPVLEVLVLKMMSLAFSSTVRVVLVHEFDLSGSSGYSCF